MAYWNLYKKFQLPSAMGLRDFDYQSQPTLMGGNPLIDVQCSMGAIASGRGPPLFKRCRWILRGRHGAPHEGGANNLHIQLYLLLQRPHRGELVCRVDEAFRASAGLSPHSQDTPVTIQPRHTGQTLSGTNSKTSHYHPQVPTNGYQDWHTYCGPNLLGW